MEAKQWTTGTSRKNGKRGASETDGVSGVGGEGGTKVGVGEGGKERRGDEKERDGGEGRDVWVVGGKRGR